MSQITPPVTDSDRKKISNAGWEIYNRKLKAVLDSEHLGEVVAIHLDTEDYEVSPQSSRARSKLRGRHPDGMIVTTDIGPVDPYDILSLRMLATKMPTEQSRSGNA